MKKQDNAIIGIYKITNPKGKIYIGQSINIEKRKKRYEKHIKHMSSQPKIYNSILKYGWEQHVFEIIEECPIDNLVDKEIYYKTKFIEENGWEMALFINIKDEGGEPFTEETKQKISKSKKGHKCYNDEWRKKISKSLKERNHSQYYISWRCRRCRPPASTSRSPRPTGSSANSRSPRPRCW